MAEASPHIWLLSAYRADSHAAWADWLQQHVHEVHWHVRELPGRHFRWRIRGSPLSWLDDLPGQTPDRIVATSMVDLATLRGLHPRLAPVPVDYYFHENQFAYPVSPGQVESLEPQVVQLYGALAADRLLFNSRFNRDSFLDGARELLRRMPDATPERVPERLAARSSICPVPVHPIPAAPERDHGLILWNHRWEYDKAPDLFADAVIGLARAGYRFRLALLGARPRTPPDALTRLRAALPERIIADGRVATPAYRELVGRAGIVVSTAAHEFQGLAMLEAASAGAIPLVPDALCYPEQYPEQYRYPVGDAAALQARLAAWLTGDRPPPADVSPWLAPAVEPAWRRVIRGEQAESVV
ncbi:tRNA-queuosine alpha-mannosyltransferase domain-containing protein [Aquisalimonas asiatica]|uniref:tRNA-queuosine alpha-mannosyltransferase n=1 Tax=Aquisalimonas asiatica TaxID=406100 RepID=A0A1H8V111_9GAMM|nr:DUF3524 domain-containing protein [Aquisalimonas asiatica]SEP09190.1 Glycosyltransferase involved in cell wall bisynthesis [Aquisalimonas asiatica]